MGNEFGGINLDAAGDSTELEEFAFIARQLADYATHKAGAMRFRVRGNIECATHHENAAERIYEGLPPSIRW